MVEYTEAIFYDGERAFPNGVSKSNDCCPV